MDEIWLVAPSPAMRLHPDRRAENWRVNAAAARWLETSGLGRNVWPLIADELRQAQRSQTSSSGELGRFALRWESVPMPTGWLVWLTPITTVPRTALAAWGSAADKLALIQEFASIGVFERDLRTYQALWDAQTFRLFDLDPQGGMPSVEAMIAKVHPDERERFRETHQRFVREGGRHVQRCRVVCRDGTVRDLQLLVEVLHDAGGQPLKVVGLVADDTESANRLRLRDGLTADLLRALHMAQVMVWRFDLATRRVLLNDYGYELSGFAPRAEGVPLAEIRSRVHPEDVPKIDRADAEAAAGTEAVDLVARYTDARGVQRHLLSRRIAERNAHGHVTGLLGVALDRTAAIAEQARLTMLSRHLEVVTEAAEMGIWTIDFGTGRMEWNDQMFRIYGLPREAGTPSVAQWLEAIHPDDRPRVAALRERVDRSGEPGFEVEFRVVRPDGSERWVVSRVRREVRVGPDVLIGIHLDTTEMRGQYQIAERAMRDKRDAQRASRAKSDLLARVSHELRTPLNAVLGFAQLIEQDAARASPTAQLERVGRIRRAGEHLLALIDNVLDLAAVDAGKLPVAIEAVELDTVFVEVSHWLGAMAVEAQVTVHLQACGGSVQADPRRLRQIVVSLLNNAIKYNHAGGNVWLGAQRCEIEGRPWQINVRDDGPGFSPLQRQHLFEAFNRLDAERDGIEGVGLGLTLVRSLVEFMGGSVDVVSTPGSGSEFQLRLPAASATDGAVPTPPLANAAQPPTAHESRNATMTVLYVEDNLVNAILVRELIALRPELTLHIAVDGAQGVAMALELRPDLVLIDIGLPDFDGFEVLRRLRAESSLEGSAMVALSANTLAEDIARARAAGFDDYWTKPIDFRQFLDALDTVLARLRVR